MSYGKSYLSKSYSRKGAQGSYLKAIYLKAILAQSWRARPTRKANAQGSWQSPLHGHIGGTHHLRENPVRW